MNHVTGCPYVDPPQHPKNFSLLPKILMLSAEPVFPRGSEEVDEVRALHHEYRMASSSNRVDSVE